jgi:hypothetical protein
MLGLVGWVDPGPEPGERSNDSRHAVDVGSRPRYAWPNQKLVVKTSIKKGRSLSMWGQTLRV